MLFALTKNPVKPGIWYIVETDNVKMCKAQVTNIERVFDDYSNSYTDEYEYTFKKKNGFIFRVTHETKSVKIVEDVENEHTKH